MSPRKRSPHGISFKSLIMKKSKISAIARFVLFLCGVALVAVLFVPMWRIDLQAPQYPEGLRLLIHPHKLAGNVDIINGLNHYIGMKRLNVDDFPEFKILPFIIIFFALFSFVVAIIGSRKWLNILFWSFVAFGVVAMIDFWRWEYDYGHNLDPNAAIIVPGMAYQPPLIGFKQLLNFGAYSMPDTGGWIFVGVGALLLGMVILEYVRKRKSRLQTDKLVLGLATGFVISLAGCSTGPDPIRIGKDSCHFCKMVISDNRFGAEIVSTKSKTYKFDDEHCLMAFIRSAELPKANIRNVYFVNFCEPHELVDAEKAIFLQSPALKSPMNGNIAAFTNEDSLNNKISTFYGNKISWEDLQK